MDVNLENLRIEVPENKTAAQKNGRGWKLVSLFLALALVILGIYHFASRPEGGEGFLIETFPVTYSAGGSSSIFTSGGWVEPAFPCPVVVSSLVSGRIEKLQVVEGSTVEEGQVIAVIYQKDFRDALAKAEAELSLTAARLGKLRAGYRKEEIEQARAAAAQAQARLDRFEAGYRLEEIDKAKAQLVESQRIEQNEKSIWERNIKLFDKGAISKEELESQKTRYDAASAKTARALEALKLLEAGYRSEEVEEAKAAAREAKEKLNLLESGFRKEDIEEARAQMEKASAAAELARSHLAYTEIRAPVTGTILELYVDQGDYITANNSEVVSIYKPQDMQVRVDVRQENIARLEIGQSARIMTDARKNKPYKGEVIRIDPKANLARDTVRAKVKIQDPDGLLHPEMTATVDFLDKAKEKEGLSPSLIVPRSAVLTEGGESFLFVVRQGAVYKTGVVLGKTSGTSVEIVSGVAEGESVALTGVRQLKDGQKVRIK